MVDNSITIGKVINHPPMKDLLMFDVLVKGSDVFLKRS